MNQLTVAPDNQTASPAAVAAVYVDGRRRSDLFVLSWSQLEPPHWGALVVACADGASLPPAGAAVRAELGGSSIEGVVTRHSLELGGGAALPTAHVAHRLAEDFSAPVSGLWCVEGGEPVAVASQRVRFGGPEGGCGAELNFRGRTCRLFDASSERAWTVADALGYLLATGAPAAVGAPTPRRLAELGAQCELDALEVTGLPLGEALAKVASAGGLALRAAGRAVEAYRPGDAGPVGRVSLAAPPASASAGDNLLHARLDLPQRPSRPNIVAIGARKRYESTFVLKGAWDPSLQNESWRTYVRSLSTRWTHHADVFRLWALNEHGGYSGAPWNLPVHDFSSIAPGEFPRRRARALLPALRMAAGEPLGVYVEYRLAADAQWHSWAGLPLISRRQCAVYLADDALPSDFVAAVRAGAAQVRVTACVEADARLRAEHPGDNGARTRVVHVPRARWRCVHSSSALGAAPPVAGQVDDSALLAAAARQAARQHAAMTAQLTLARVEPQWALGDRVARIDGRGIELAASRGVIPWVVAVEHDFAAQTTRLTIRG
jgi:hypothetical protein